MALQRPYINNKFISYEGDKTFTDLSIATRLIDDYTGEEPEGAVKVMIKKGNIKCYKNPGGYYIFTNLDDGNFTVDVESDLYFHEESTIDTLKLKTLDAIPLVFESVGPLIGKTNAQLKDVSKLQKGYVIEFRNTKGETQEKTIKEIDVDNRVIKWRKGLKKPVSAFLFTWGDVPGIEEEKERLRNFLMTDLDINWVKKANIQKINENTIHVFIPKKHVPEDEGNVPEDEESLDIILDRTKRETIIKIKDGPEYKLWTEKEGIYFKIYGGTVRAQKYLAGIILKPKPFYPFPDHATLVRGWLVSKVDSNEIPVNEAIVKVVDYEIETKTDGNGEFVLYFNKIENNNIKIEIEKNGGLVLPIDAIIEEGKTNIVGKIVLPL